MQKRRKHLFTLLRLDPHVCWCCARHLRHHSSGFAIVASAQLQGNRLATKQERDRTTPSQVLGELKKGSERFRHPRAC